MLYSATARGGFRVPGFHDPDSVRPYGILFRPPTWLANTVYYLRGPDDYDTIIPTTFEGFYYKVISPGKTGASEPTDWATTAGGQTTSGSCTFEAVPYNLLPPERTVTASTWAATNLVTISLPAFTTTETSIQIDAVPAGVESFTLTNHYTLDNGKEDDISVLFVVGER